MIRLSIGMIWACFAAFVAAQGVPPEGGGKVGGTQPAPTALVSAAGKPIHERFDVLKTPDQRFCVHERDDQQYAGLCDVYVPRSRPSVQLGTDHRWPVVLVVHGGAWVTGSKQIMERHSRQLASKGIAAVAINYRLAPTSKFPEQVDDVRSALAWITENAEAYSFDTDRVGLYGYSAGGHLVSLVATLADEPWEKVSQTTDWPEQDERWGQLPPVCAVCAGGPPTDFRGLPLDNTSLSFFLGGSRRDCPDVYAMASPICFASAADPPFQIIHGEADWIVPVNNATRFHDALVESDVQSTLETLPGNGHIVAFFSPQLSASMLRFFEEHLAER